MSQYNNNPSYNKTLFNNKLSHYKISSFNKTHFNNKMSHNNNPSFNKTLFNNNKISYKPNLW